jgi:two-component system, NtrC family, sensor histidine kinase AtoS
MLKMSTLPNLTSRTSLWKNKEPGLNELNSLLNLFNEPALLLDRSKKIIVGINSSLSKLTAFGSQELIGQPEVKLLPDLEGEVLEFGMSRTINVQRCKRSPLAVQLHCNALDSSGRWMFISLVPSQRVSQSAQQEKAFMGLSELSRFSEEDNPFKFLEKAIKAVQEITDAGFVCVYHNFPDLGKLASNEDPIVFPERLSTIDLARLSSYSLWNPGKRVQNDIHRAARQADLSYAASIPLGKSGAATGLLVVADSEKQPLDVLHNLMGIFGSLISSALQHYILVGAQADTITKQSDELNVLQAFIKNAQEGIILLNPDRIILDLNPTAELMLQYSRTDVIGQPVEKVLIGSDQLIPSLEVASQGVATHNIGNSFLNKRYGDSFAAQIQIIPVQTDNKVQAILVYIADVSEHEQFRARTQQLEQRAILGQFSSIIAHEVRNPINNISLNLRLISSDLDESDPNQDNIKMMLNDCNRLVRMVESILSYSRLETKFETVDMEELIQYQINRWQPRMKSLNIIPSIQVGENVPKIWGDSRSLEQVFTNLISNAVEAMSKEGGTLAVNINRNCSNKSYDQVEITVSDSGPGIPDDIRPHIFEPFVTSNKRGGTGLGLAITKMIIDAQHGHIDVQSYPGVTIFTVLLMTQPIEAAKSNGES